MYNAQERTKLDLKSRRYIFLGYTNRVNEYHMWNSTAHKIIIRKRYHLYRNQLQKRDMDYSNIKEKSKTVPIYVENNPEYSDSFKAAPEYEEQ